MIWSALFFISIVQGLFLIAIISTKGSKNALASRFMILLLVMMILMNLVFLIIRSSLLHIIPQILGLTFGLNFLFGPLLFFYSKSVIDPLFKWRKIYFLHFTPYLIYLLINYEAFLQTRQVWVYIIEVFLSGTMAIGKFEIIFFPIQCLHFSVYLFYIFKLTKISESNSDTSYLISISSRAQWIKNLFYSFVALVLALLSMYVFVLITGLYTPVADYVYTLISSLIIYLIAYRLIANAELIHPNFLQKYNSYRQLNDNKSEKCLEKLSSLMIDSKMYCNPELSLSSLAKEIGITSHQLSKLINEKFGKSFNDYVNEYRVKEFISLLNNPKFKSHNIYGIALEAGFNSKSSFNSTFKKITGKTPSEFKSPN